MIISDVASSDDATGEAAYIWSYWPLWAVFAVGGPALFGYLAATTDLTLATVAFLVYWECAALFLAVCRFVLSRHGPYRACTPRPVRRWVITLTGIWSWSGPAVIPLFLVSLLSHTVALFAFCFAWSLTAPWTSIYFADDIYRRNRDLGKLDPESTTKGLIGLAPVSLPWYWSTYVVGDWTRTADRS